MNLDKKVIEEVIDLLLPLMSNPNRRRPLLNDAFFGHHILSLIDYSGASYVFTRRLVDDLVDFGEIAVGKTALWLLMETAKNQVGLDKQRRIDELRSKLNMLSNEKIVEKSPESRGGNVRLDDSLLGPIRKRWALVVGVNKFLDSSIPDLKYCVNDALSMKDLLNGLGYNTVTLHDDGFDEYIPNKHNIESKIENMIQASDPDDLLLIYFACHGFLEDDEPILVVRDTYRNRLKKQGLPVAEIEKTMRCSGRRRLILILDACHTGASIGRDLSDPAFIRNVYDLAEGFALIAASSSQQITVEIGDKFEHGIFTYYLLKGLRGQAKQKGKEFITVQDLSNYTVDRLREWSYKNSNIIYQPTKRIEGLGEMILADFRNGEQR